ncbi:glycine zipper 2TM domain-containing protein [Limnobacter parvus]|uniref:Glycine zipper 2TM domain-containing protein n=1 Tax=Limnobacter parvus TaxID=2939690 RepID=A0ABT1XGY3_9BURK|nr:glycine zipper 2TM domain-containing protein [Limnobacter parvus]MCR2746154.1 glycine zipper 2TM domain-containing protein [Limnobacter parvus]
MAKSVQFSFRSTGAVALIALSALAAGCATQSSSGQVYREGETRRAQIVEQGVVESVRNVTIQGDTNNVGTAAGGIVGGIAGSNVGGGSGRAVGAVLGAVAGGLAGQAVERNASTRAGLEITVRMDNGTLRAYVQDADDQFRPGDRVRIVSSGGTSRVTR